MLPSFTLQDLSDMLVAIMLFPFVLVFPGYDIAWASNIFSFRKRTTLARYVLAIATSSALVPIILFFAFRFFSPQFGVGTIMIFFLVWAAVQFRSWASRRAGLVLPSWQKAAFTIGGIWMVFCIFLLVDVQIGQRLYFNAASYDFTTRTALIEAVTRTGIPMVNPGYYPGHFERITELYYFWYILGSIVDILGGRWVDARMALFAGIAWTGLSLIATIAMYLRLRNPESGIKAWRLSTLGAQMIAVSGLDFLPVMTLMIAIKTTFGYLPFDGRIEGWNLPVMSWLNAITWVPNHVAGLIACTVAMLAILTCDYTNKSRWLVHVVVAGASIGSAFGLSVWVPVTFGLFMAVWAVSLLFAKGQRALLVAIIAAGILGLVFAAPFLADILRSGGRSEVTGAAPVALYVRHFMFSKVLPPGIREVVGVLLLPLNYFFELGFFFAIAILWIHQRRKSQNWLTDPFWRAEFLLLATVAILLSFVKSTVIAFNDLGMRAWLLGQFVLIIWAIDILKSSSKEGWLLTPSFLRSIPASKRVTDLLGILLIVGFLTTALEATSTRFWTILVDAGVTGVPNELTPDRQLGERTYDARLAYEYVRDHTPQDMIIQNNPATLLDRPSGLYGTRQMAIADRTGYGVPKEIFTEMSKSIGEIFLAEDVSNWVEIDKVCSQYFIQAIIVNDTDALWRNLPVLQRQRAPMYRNRHYALFSCGD
jgi:hypothetical protein